MIDGLKASLAEAQRDRQRRDKAYETLKAERDSLAKKNKALSEKPDRKAKERARAAALLSLDGAELDTALNAEMVRAPHSAWAYVLRTHVALAGPERNGGALLPNDTRTQNNIGCRSTTVSLLQALEAAGVRCDRTVTLAELQLLAPTLWHVAGEPPMPDNLDLMVATFRDHPAFSLYRRAIGAVSSIIVNGEGSFYDAQEKGLVLIVMACYAAREAGKPVAILNHSAELSHPLMAAWSAATYPLMRAVTFREPVSARRLPGGMSGAANISSGADAAFLAAFDEEEELGNLAISGDALFAREIAAPYVVLTGTSSIYRIDRAPYTAEAAFADLCRALKDLDGYTPVLWEGDAGDARLLRPTALRLGLPYVSAGISTPAALRLLRGATAIVSGRWHASILAACAGTPPVLGDANFFKTEALHEMLGLEWPMFDYRTLDSESVRRSVREIASGGNALRARIEAQAARHAGIARAEIGRAVARLS